MRVLLTTDTVGGVWTFTGELSEQLVNLGHSVALVSFGRVPSAAQSAWAEEMAAAHGGLFAFYPSDAPLEWMQDNMATWAGGAELLTDVAAEFEPDILHSNQFCWGALPMQLPTLITAHSDVWSWAAACRRESLPPSAWLERYRILVQDGIDGADAMVAPTAWMRDALRQHCEVATPFHVIPNGCTVREITKRTERKLQAISAGRLWDEAKGLSTVSEITSPMPIFLAGEASFEEARSSNAPSCFRPLGPLHPQSLHAAFSASCVYIASSVYEPFGLAPLEAALCGCAVVARDLPSFREVWGDAALYFEDAGDLQLILTELASDQALLHRAQANAMERAQFFSGTRMACSYISLYRDLTGDGASGISRDEAAEELSAA
jgi:glycogen(starch) synthase